MKSLQICRSALLRPNLQVLSRRSAPRNTNAFQTRPFSTVLPLRQAQVRPEKPVNFYRSHGRALAKALTLAFLSYQIVYWAWLYLETEEIKHEKNQEIKALEREVRLLDENRRSQKSGG
ncbi:hypothetical protein ABEF95_003213 [Exophiala dermatitidis]